MLRRGASWQLSRRTRSAAGNRRTEIDLAQDRLVIGLMRLFVVSMLAIWSTTATAQTIGLFADSLGTDCNIQIPFPGGSVTAYAIGTRPPSSTQDFKSFAFRIDGLPAGWNVSGDS
jgi:hypothetical protein